MSCSRCGKEIQPATDNYINQICSDCCNKVKENIPYQSNWPIGWQCPVCGWVYSPYKLQCDWCPILKLGNYTTESIPEILKHKIKEE